MSFFFKYQIYLISQIVLKIIILIQMYEPQLQTETGFYLKELSITGCPLLQIPLMMKHFMFNHISFRGLHVL